MRQKVVQNQSWGCSVVASAYRQTLFRWIGLSGVSILLCVQVTSGHMPEEPHLPVKKRCLILHNWANLPKSGRQKRNPPLRARVPEQINFYTASVKNPDSAEQGYRQELAEDSPPWVRWGKARPYCVWQLSVLEFALPIPRHRCFQGCRSCYGCCASGSGEDVAWHHRL